MCQWTLLSGAYGHAVARIGHNPQSCGPGRLFAEPDRALQRAREGSVDEESNFGRRLIPSLIPIGTIRTFKVPDTQYYKLTRLAVLKEYRQFSFGRGSDRFRPNSRSLPDPSQGLLCKVWLSTRIMLRLKLRRKTASETLRPFVTDITKVACTNGEACSIDQGRSLIQRICRLVQVVNSWGKAVTGSSEEHSSCNALLMDLLTDVLVVYAPSIHSCVAQRTFAIYYSRLVLNPNLDANWEPGEQVMQYAIALVSKPSIGDLVLDAKPLPKLGSLLEILLPAILSAFQSGVALDECMALLLNVLHELHSYGSIYLLSWHDGVLTLARIPRYELITWIPVLVSFLVALGVGGKHFSNPEPSTPVTVATILSFGSTIAGFSLTYSSISSDFTTYYHPEASSWAIFLYTYFGLLISMVTPLKITLQSLGAAAAIASTYVPSWGDGYQGGNIGGLLAAMLSPTGRFGKFLTVLLSLSVSGNIAANFYSFCPNVQVFIPFLVVVPRYIFSIVAAAIVIPLSIVGAHRFSNTLENFLGLVGYWAGAYIGIILMEHLVFRRNDFEQYNVHNWDKARLLPSGVASVAAGIASFGLVVPCMAQALYTGPIAKITGDIGFEVAFLLGSILYIPFRALEIRIHQRAFTTDAKSCRPPPHADIWSNMK
ncbi:hypothetical protein F5887DRAFT_1158926 [Amanita rubescens]|nr:hypothetical protein F5887DRAFT_1158926 [Amanita rubescens]